MYIIIYSCFDDFSSLLYKDFGSYDDAFEFYSNIKDDEEYAIHYFFKASEIYHGLKNFYDSVERR